MLLNPVLSVSLQRTTAKTLFTSLGSCVSLVPSRFQFDILDVHQLASTTEGLVMEQTVILRRLHLYCPCPSCILLNVGRPSDPSANEMTLRLELRWSALGAFTDVEIPTARNMCEQGRSL
jgi:hypothetical protein